MARWRIDRLSPDKDRACLTWLFQGTGGALRGTEGAYVRNEPASPLIADPWFAVREVVYRRNRSRRAIVAGRGIARKCPSATVGNGTSRPHAAQQNGSSEGARASLRPSKTAASAHISPKCEPGSRPRALAARCRPRGAPAAGSALPRACLRIRSLQPKCRTPRRRKPKPERPLAFDRALELIRLAEKYKFAAGMAAQTYTNPALVSVAATPAASYS